MVFNSLQFLLFFPIVTILYFVTPFRFRWALLLVASCLFYMAFIPWYILILAATIVIDYFAGILIAQAQGRKRKMWLGLSLVANVGVLAIFKYFYFLHDNLAALANLFHWDIGSPILQIILPIGLSFHTFQAMSYTIEVYRGHQEPERHFGIYSLYVMFYPQLVAGPIERPQNLLPQFRTEHKFDYDRVVDGLKLMLWGFFKKVVIADNLAADVNRVYGDPTSYQGIPLIVATVFFAYQIYCDFSGYTDIARGSARVMGFELMRNFRSPYTSTSIVDFWRRWHISLSTWFRDYVYIPLGGNRKGTIRWCINLSIVFLISGLWHGASWMFIIWGALHGFYLVCSIITEKPRERFVTAIGLTRFPRVHRAIKISITFSLVCFAWIFFRAQSMPDAIYIVTHLVPDLKSVFTPSFSIDALRQMGAGLGGGMVKIALLSVVILELVHLIERKTQFKSWFNARPIWFRWAGYYATVLWIFVFGNFGEKHFIYFQF